MHPTVPPAHSAEKKGLKINFNLRWCCTFSIRIRIRVWVWAKDGACSWRCSCSFGFQLARPAILNGFIRRESPVFVAFLYKFPKGFSFCFCLHCSCVGHWAASFFSTFSFLFFFSIWAGCCCCGHKFVGWDLGFFFFLVFCGCRESCVNQREVEEKFNSIENNCRKFLFFIRPQLRPAGRNVFMQRPDT